MIDYKAIPRDAKSHLSRRLWDVYAMQDGKPIGKPVVKALGEAEAMRVAASLRDWQPNPTWFLPKQSA